MSHKGEIPHWIPSWIPVKGYNNNFRGEAETNLYENRKRKMLKKKHMSRPEENLIGKEIPKHLEDLGMRRKWKCQGV